MKPPPLISTIVLVCLFTLSLHGQDRPVAETARPKVLIIGIDGARFDAIEKAATPNLDALMKTGITWPSARIAVRRFLKADTVSGPGWSSILTGVWADKHGVLDNSFAGARYDQYPSLFQRLEERHPTLRTVSFSTWAPIKDQINTVADVRENIHVDGATATENDIRCADACVAELENRDPDCLLCYMGHVDSAGHNFGFHPSVPQYIAAIETVDQQVGRLLSALKNRAQREQEDWLILVSSDHGGQGTGHSGGQDDPEILNSFLIVAGDRVPHGETGQDSAFIVDVATTALGHFGMLEPDWKLDGVDRSPHLSRPAIEPDRR